MCMWYKNPQVLRVHVLTGKTRHILGYLMHGYGMSWKIQKIAFLKKKAQTRPNCITPNKHKRKDSRKYLTKGQEVIKIKNTKTISSN